MILLFAATKHRFHQRDVLNVCCYDKGEYVRFGYERKLIETGLCKKGGQKLKGKALVVFCEYIPGDNGDSFSYRFHPIRFVKIVEAQEDDAGSFSIDFRLDEYPTYESEADLNTKWLDSFQEAIEGLEQRPTFGDENSEGGGGRLKRKFVAKASFATLDGRMDGDWVGLVKHLGKKSDLRQCLFYRNVNSLHTQFDPIHPKSTFKSGRALTSLSVGSGQVRQLSLQVMYGKDHCVREPNLSVAGVGEAHGPLVRQASDGFYFDYWIAVEKTMSERSGVLSLEVRSPQDNGDELSDIYGPERYSLVQVKPQWITVLSVVALLAIGSWLPDFYDSLFLKSVGAVMFGIGLLFAFRRMPFGD